MDIQDNRLRGKSKHDQPLNLYTHGQISTILRYKRSTPYKRVPEFKVEADSSITTL